MAIWFKPKRPVCDCEADETVVSTPRIRVVKKPPTYRPVRKESRIVRHYRKRDEAHFWHWEDQKKP